MFYKKIGFVSTLVMETENTSALKHVWKGSSVKTAELQNKISERLL